MVKTIAKYDSNAEIDNKGFNEWDLLYMAVQEKRELVCKLYQNVYESMSRMSEKVLEGECNNVYSPVALYMALSVLSEMTSGDSRKQLLDLLELEDDNVLDTFNALSKIAFMDSKIVNNKVSSSIWMNDNMNYNSDKLAELSEKYQTSSFAGTMGSEEMNRAISEWINASTGNLLEKEMKVETTPDMLLEIFTTIFLSSKWDNEFDISDTKNGIFTVPGGNKVNCEFMHQETRDIYHKADNFTAVTKALNAEYEAIFVLPNEGVSVDEVFYDNQFKELSVTGGLRESTEYLIKLSMPKFDISSKVDFLEILKQLGINDVFKPGVADFSPISNEKQLYLSKTEQTSRFKVNEEGVEAASCVEMGIACLGIPPEVDEVEFKLDKPFVFMVVATGNVPIFVGKVMDPTQH